MASYSDVDFNPLAPLGLEFGPVHEDGPEDASKDDSGGSWFSWGSTEKAQVTGIGCKVVGYRGQKTEGGVSPPDGTVCGGGHGVCVGDIVVAVNSRAVVSQSFTDIMDILRECSVSGYLDPTPTDTESPRFHQQKRIRFLSWNSHENVKTALVLNRLVEGGSPDGRPSPSRSELESLLRLQNSMDFSATKSDQENGSPNVSAFSFDPPGGADKQARALLSVAKKVTFSPDVSSKILAERQQRQLRNHNRTASNLQPTNAASPKQTPSKQSPLKRSPSKRKIAGAGMTPQPLSGQSQSPPLSENSPSPLTAGDSSSPSPSYHSSPPRFAAEWQNSCSPKTPTVAKKNSSAFNTDIVDPGIFQSTTTPLEKKDSSTFSSDIVDPSVFQSTTTPLEKRDGAQHFQATPSLRSPVYTLSSSMVWETPGLTPGSASKTQCIHPDWFGYTPPAVVRAIPLTPQTIPTPQDRKNIACCIGTLRDAMCLLSLRFGDETTDGIVDPNIFQSTTTPRAALENGSVVDPNLFRSTRMPRASLEISRMSSPLPLCSDGQQEERGRRVEFTLPTSSPHHAKERLGPSSPFQKFTSPPPGARPVLPSEHWDSHMQHMELMSLIIQDCRMNLKNEGLPEKEIDEQLSGQISTLAQVSRSFLTSYFLPF
jgi:hypothetical protein